MTAYDRLDLLFQQNNGIVKTAQVLEIGIAKSTFYAYAKQRGVEQAAHGVYVSPDAWTDAMYLLHLRCAQAVFSHESALFFHDLTDREPNPYSITVKTGYNPASLQADGIKVYTIKKELHDVGIVTMNTPFGNPVPVYDMERTMRSDPQPQWNRDADLSGCTQAIRKTKRQGLAEADALCADVPC